jgi:putative sigma-54 modulation protein
MNINFTTKDIELTQAISDYAEKKVLSLEKYLTQPSDTYMALVEVGKTTRHHKEGPVYRAEVHITGGIDVYAEAEAEDLYAAIDLMESNAAKELQSKKGRRFRLLRRGQRAIKESLLGITNRFRRD